MIREGILRRYAQSLLDVALERDLYDRVHDELVQLRTLFQQVPVLMHLLDRPTTSVREKRTILQQLQERLELHPLTVRFLELLVENRRLRHFARILQLLERLYLETQGYQNVTIITAIPLDDTLRTRVRQTLEEFTGRKVILEEKVDPNILGGFVVRIGSVYYDGSVVNQIRQIRDHLIGEVPHGIHYPSG